MVTFPIFRGLCDVVNARIIGAQQNTFCANTLTSNSRAQKIVKTKLVVKSTYMNDIDTNTMSNATRCFDTTLLNVYGPNYFAASCFPDSFRVEWVKSCGIALQINETDLWHHLTLLQPERVSQTPQSTVRERALAYLSESVVHSSMWTRVSDALGTTNARNVDYASLKDELTHIRLAGGV